MKLSFISEFENYNDELLNINVNNDYIKIVSKIKESHQYYYSKFFKYENDNILDIKTAIFSYPDEGIIGAIIFYNIKKEKIGGTTFHSNQLTSLIIPENCEFLKIGIRISEEGEFNIDEFIIGNDVETQKFLENKTSIKFKYDEILIRDNKFEMPFIFVETIFCDTETNQTIINRYLNFLLSNIQNSRKSIYKNFLWVIYISEDKKLAITKIKEIIDLFELEKKIKIHLYSHPEDGYGNEKETHIDLLRRPNATIPNLRQKLTNDFFNKEEIDVKSHNLFIRTAIDDDDFFSIWHFNQIAILALKNVIHFNEKIKEIIIGTNNICVSHFLPSGKIKIDTVIFSKIITGSKFSYSQNNLPTSPFSINENFTKELINSNIKKGIYYVVEDNNLPTISYNRHGNNFSSASKNDFYIRILNSTILNSQNKIFETLNLVI